MIRKIFAFLTVAFCAASLGAIGYWLLFSNFAAFDDEGYILLSARDYLAHGKLYEGVYSQYGPACYVLIDGFQRVLGTPIDHTWARLLTLFFWLGTAGCCARLVWRETSSRSLSLFTASATFLYLYFITDEPFHPGSLIFFVLAGSLLVATSLINSGRLKSAAIVTGATGAILLLTKINVGAFYVTGVCGWAIMHAASNRLRSIAGPWVSAIFILLAAALMHTLLREAWVQIYLVLFASGAVALVLSIKKSPLIKPTQMGWFLIAGSMLGLTIPTLIWLRGTSFTGLLDGILLGPLRHPGNYSYAVDWRPGSLLVAGFSLGLACTFPWIERRFSDDVGDRLIVALRLIIAVALLTGFALLMNFRAVGAIFSFVAPLLWIWIVPIKGVPQSPAAQASRGLLAIILLLQYLHAYPVGGSQESWGTFLFMPLVALGLGDVRRWLAVRRTVDPSLADWWPRVSTLAVIVIIAKVSWSGIVAQRNYALRSALGLQGAGELHLPEGQRTAYRILALNATVHADMLFSLPGMFSFNLWTNLPTPTRKNTTLWLTLLNDAEQKEIIEVLEQSPRAGLIVQETLIELMQTNHVPLRGRLWDYLNQNYHAAFRTEAMAFWVRNGRVIAPINIASVQAGRTPGQSRDTQFEFCLTLNKGPIGSIEIRTESLSGTRPRILDASNAEVTAVPINRAGQSIAPESEVSWPLTSRGLIRLRVRFNREGLTLQPSTTFLYLKGPAGEDLGEIRIGE